MIEAREELERPGALRRAVAELGRLTAGTGGGRVGPGEALAGLRDLGSPPVLDLLFRVALRSSLRRGPAGVGETGTPGELLALAADAGAAGLLPVSTALALRDDLEALEGELRRSGAWSAAVPFWWAPVPPPGELEALRRELAGPAGPALPPLDQLAAALAAGEGAAGWIAWPGALPGGLLGRVAAELDAAGGEVFGLEPGGVGRGDRRSSRRSDAVRFLTGLEPELLERAPALAVLTQRLLEDLEEPLRSALPGRSLFAPQTAMLARYPAPSAGFDAHLDNPGGAEDNQRALTLVLYLNAPGRACRGGELAVWAPGAATGEEPAARVPAVGGSAVLFDARRVPHAVAPLAPGPDRWTLVVWLSERAQRPDRPLLPVPALTPDQALLAVEEPPVAERTVILRRIAPGGGPDRLTVRRTGEVDRRPRVGIVTTVREAGGALEGWCRHHLEVGMARLVVVLDGSEDREAEAAARDLAARLSGAGERVTVWSEAEARRRWQELPAVEELDRLRRHAEGGAAAWAVAARQALNASAALAAVRGELDWLLHLDGDELFYLQGAGSGGVTLAEHFRAVEAEGWTRVRYVNHELLVPYPDPARPGAPPRFKHNPAVAAARLGPEGWARLARLLSMEQDDRRPWFRAYWNGKSAVSVAAGLHAAGVHGWAVEPEGGGGDGEPLLAGPSVLHLHLPDAGAFRRKYLAVAAAPDDPGRPFPPSPLERAACALVRELRASGAPQADIDARLDELYRAVTAFSPEEIELLEEAGLLFTPRLEHLPLPPASPASPGGAPLRAGPRGRGGGEKPGAPLSVGILGGGTAGYLAALALRAKRPRLRVTLIESKDVPVIGVGEATTPLMPQFLHADLGIPAAELFREVRPTFKLGIRFLWGWPASSGGGAFPYPFGPVRPLEAAVWDGHLGRCSPGAALMAAGALPVEAPVEGGAWRAAFGTQVAYHLDNRRLAAFLKRQALARGVEVVDARVTAVETGPPSGGGAPRVAALVAEDGRRFSFDLYLDCSGFRSLLVGEALGSPFLGYERSLFTDRALVAAVPRNGPLPPYTEARTLAAGWSWTIPQEGEDHIGYVYSSAFATPEEAAAELRRALPGCAGASLRELSFRPGRRAHFWRGNAVALGNAYGFVEPLESTALHLLIRQIGLLLQALPEHPEEGAVLAPLANARVAAFWDYVAWFLALHFRFNRRLETPFWRACREGADVSAHGELLELFRERGPLSYDPAARALFAYPDPLWGPEGIDTILLGQGVEARLPRPAVTREAWHEQTALYDKIAARSLPQDEVLRHLHDHPEVLEALEEAFKRHGPAFP
jgi:tryptophan halogenase